VDAASAFVSNHPDIHSEVKMANRLAGKIAIISGGATGMGGASSRLFAAEGAKVAIIDRNAAAAEETAADIRKTGGICEVYAADVSDEAQVQSAVRQVESSLGPVTVLFNHAGTIVIKPFLETTLEEWDWLHAVNVRSMFLMTRAVLPGMIAAGGGSIVCTSSISAVAATPMEVLYDTTKGAVHMFARAIAVEFRDRNIRCNAVCPGFIRTPHGLREVAELTAHGVDVSEAALAAQQGRIGEPEDVARAALYLASDDSQFVNGIHLFVDNGFTAI
jgi:NAD(P)-dependent dehydrogenase (short-subunit alcohol dehydrogenase family)